MPKSVLQLFVALLLLSLFLPSISQDISQVTDDPLFIYQVSTIRSYYDYAAEGGILGGTKLHISGFGFDQVPQNNLVIINLSPCKVIETNYDSLVCITGPAAATTFSTIDNTVSIYVAGKGSYTCHQCYFYYRYAQTPTLNKIYPRSGTYQSRTSFIGYFAVFYTLGDDGLSQINSVKIGHQGCSYDGLSQNFYGDNSQLRCDVMNQQGGYYNVSTWLAAGYSKKRQSMLISSLINLGVSYDYILNPVVQSISSHSGPTTGNKITITGTGFSSDSSLIQVTAAGLPCTVISSTTTNIQCNIAEDFNGNTYGKLTSNSTQQKNGFTSGTGFIHQIYNLTKLQYYVNGNLSTPEVSEFRAHYLNNSDKIEKIAASNFSTRKVLGELEFTSADISDILNRYSYYGSVIAGVSRGYFVAPKTATYKFNLYSSMNISVYVSNFKGSQEIDYTTPFLKYEAMYGTNFYNNGSTGLSEFQQLVNPSMSSSIDMVAGESRYFEIFFIPDRFSGDSNFYSLWKLNLVIPNTDPVYHNTECQIQTISIAGDQDPEILAFEHIGATEGYFEYSYGTQFYDKTYVKFDASAQDVKKAIQKYYFVSGFNPQITRETYDYASVLTSSSGNPIYSYKYLIKLNTRRPSYYAKQSYYTVNVRNHNATNTVNNTVPTSKSYQVQEASPEFNGSFHLSYKGEYLRYSISSSTPEDIYMYTSGQTIESLFYNQFQISIRVFSEYEGSNFKKYVVYFEGEKGNVQQLVTQSSKLTGGRVGGSPPIAKVTTVRDGSHNLVFEPIVSEFLRTPSAKPTVQVKVNGVLSQCGGDCSYEVDASTNIPQIISASLSSNVLNFALDSFVATPYDVIFADQPCTYLSGTHSDYKCALPKHSNGDPIIEAGLYLPKVLIPNKGYAKYLNTLNKIDVPLTITSLTPNTGSPNGGMVTQISGKGFPISSDRTFTLKQCDIDVLPISVSNDLISFYSAECAAGTSTNVKLTFNLKEATSAFTYTSTSSIKISSITPASHSPVLKGFMTVTGEGFGTDRSLLKAWLTLNNANVYQLNVLEASDTTLKLKIPGGQSGVFKVKVLRTDIGYASIQTADANKFIYGIFVDSISPLVGSKFGGTIITIIGENFSTELAENQVYIGDAINWRCQMLTATKTQITCRTPALHPSYTVVDQNVTVVGRAMIDSECRGECKFSYDNVTFPTVDSLSSYYYSKGEVITLQGTGLEHNGVPQKVFIGQTQATIVSSSDTHTSFMFPSLYYGEYSFNLYVDGVGYANEVSKMFSIFHVGINDFSGSTEGTIMLVTGSGFLPFTSNKFNVSALLSSIIKYQVLEVTPSVIKIEIGKCYNGQTINFSFQMETSYANVMYTCSSFNTPIVALKSSNEVAFDSTTQVIQFNQTVTEITGAPSSVAAYLVDADGDRFDKQDIVLTMLSNTGSEFTVDGSVLASGKYKFKVYYAGKGYAACTDTVLITETAAPTVTSVQSGYNGGPEIKITGSGLNLKSKLIIGQRVEAQIDKVKSTSSELYYKAPQYLNQLNYQTFAKLSNQLKLTGEYVADKEGFGKNAFDNKISTKYTTSPSGGFIGLDFGKIKRAVVTRIKYLLNQTDVEKIIGAKISGSNDKTAWADIAVIEQQANGGWNTWVRGNVAFDSYRYIAIRSQTTQFAVSEVQFFGYFVAEPLTSLVSNNINVDFSNGFYSHTAITQIQYRQDRTPIVTALSKRFGTPLGEDSLTITGTNFGTDSSKVKVIIDGVECVVQTTTDTSITCTTGKRDTMPTVNTFAVSVNQNLAVVKSDSFTYGYRWSDEATWGGDFPPVEGDTVYVPEGMVLIVDQSTPKLQLILVEGTIIFADQSAITVQAEIILIVRGKLVAGTQSQPYQNQLTFILSGNYYARQLPQFGNKVIGCYNCIFDMHGRKRNVVWTQLSQTANAGSNQIKLTTAVDWTAGEQIVLASTSYEHSEAEQKTIAAIDATKKIITLTDALKYSHKSTSQMYGNKNIALRGQVGLLSRNIKIQGHSDSSKGKYGAHLMMYGTTEKGLISKIQYTEFSDCGQQQTLKYCIFFNRNGDLTKSLVKGNSIHHSYARAIALKASSYLTIDNNVAYLTAGHSIYLETGTQQYNVIQNNLIISTIRAGTLYQTDVSPSSFYLTNPLNTLTNNRAAGSDGNGITYFLGYPLNSSRSSSLPIKNSINNIAHSNGRSGLRIFRSLKQHQSAWPTKNTFSNYVLWNNKQYGVSSIDFPNTIFNNFIVVNFGYIGISLNHNNLNCNDSITISNSLLASEPTNPYNNITAIYSSDTPNYISNVTFCNFNVYSNLISLYPLYYSFQTLNYLKQIYTFNVTGKFISNSGYDNVTIKIEDSSLSEEFDGVSRAASTIISYAPHSVISEKCFLPLAVNRWQNLTICNPDVEINIIASISQNYYYDVRVKRLSQDYETIFSNSSTSDITNLYSQSTSNYLAIIKTSFIGGYTYNIWLRYQTEMPVKYISAGCVSPPLNEAIVLRYNYSNTYQSIYTIVDGVTKANSLTPLNKSTCNYGDFHLTKRYFFVCISARGWKSELKIEIVSVLCQVNCPPPIDYDAEIDIICPDNVTALNWSNTLIWRKGRIPIAGQNVTVPYNCSIIMDVDVENLNVLMIDGVLTVKDENRILSAKFIWVKGTLQAGTKEQAFQNNFSIKLLGARLDPTFVVDQNIGWGKSLVVTGKLYLYGITPTTTYTKLTSNANVGDTTINVQSTAGWAVGQTLGISPSFSNYYEYEKVTITSLTATSVIFTPALSYAHYGSSTPLINSYGELDMRSTVGVFDRNIKILRDDDAEQWGYSVLVYGWRYSNVVYSGSAVFNAVQFQNGGQFASERAALNVMNTVIGNTSTFVTNSVFENCFDYCMYLRDTKNLRIENNFLFEGQRFLVYAERTESYVFKSNVMIGARNRSKVPSGENIACYDQYNYDVTNITVQDNICQGSQGSGFIIPWTSCGNLNQNTGYVRNTAGSANIGFVLSHQNSNYGCKTAGYLRVYGCNIGITSNPYATSVVWDHLMLADNKRSLGLRFGGENQNNNSLFLTNSWISAVSRPECELCYADGKTSCSDSNALRLLVVGKNNFVSIDDSIQSIQSTQDLDGNAWIYNTTFTNFQLNYSSAFTNSLSTRCSNNRLFEVHPSADSSIGNHHFFNTSCTNCHDDSVGYFASPIQSNLGWQGGCGTILCTGRSNYLMLDHDGSLIGHPGTIVPSNPEIGSLPNCVQNNKTNGYVCNRTDIGRLKFSSIAKDYRTRIMWPVNLTNQDSNLTTTINAWRETSWNGGEPSNRRYARFLSLVQFGHCYNISFAAQPPSDMLFSFSLPKLEGDNSKWICIKMYYPVPNSISVTYSSGAETKSIISTSRQSVTDYPNLCGTHKYFYKQSVIHFVVTGDANCQARVTLTSSVQVTARLSVEVSTFYENNGAVKFLDLISAFLNIPTNRLKIVGVYSGSTIVDFTITPELSSISTSTDVNPGATEIVQDLKRLAEKISTAGSSVIPQLLSVTTIITAMDQSGQPVPVIVDGGQGDENIKSIIIGSVVGGVVLLIGIIATVFIIKKMRARRGIAPQLDTENDARAKGLENVNVGSHYYLNERRDQIHIHNFSNNNSMRPVM